MFNLRTNIEKLKYDNNLLINTIVITKHIVTTNDASDKRVKTSFLSVIHLSLNNHQGFVNGSKYTQVKGVLFGCSQDTFDFTFYSICIYTCLTHYVYLYKYIETLRSSFEQDGHDQSMRESNLGTVNNTVSKAF